MSKYVWILGLSLAALQAAGAETTTQYRVNAVIDPVAQTVTASIEIANPTSNRFYLHKGFALSNAMADGKAVSINTDR
jgi:hypothetical protein